MFLSGGGPHHYYYNHHHYHHHYHNPRPRRRGVKGQVGIIELLVNSDGAALVSHVESRRCGRLLPVSRKQSVVGKNLGGTRASRVGPSAARPSGDAAAIQSRADQILVWLNLWLKLASGWDVVAFVFSFLHFDCMRTYLSQPVTCLLSHLFSSICISTH